MKKLLIYVLLLVVSSTAYAATLKKEFVNEDGDRICVYSSHFKEIYVNVGFSKRCSFNVPDDKL